VEYRKISIEGIQLRWNGGRGRLEVFHWRDSENGDRGNVKRAKKKVDGQRKWHPEKKHKGEYKREDTKGRAEAKNITKTAKVRVFERSGFKKKKRRILGLRKTICGNMGRGTELGKNRRNRRKIKNTNGNVNEQNEERRNEEHRRRSLENFGIDMLFCHCLA
jgi:hypothetical protein